MSGSHLGRYSVGSQKSQVEIPLRELEVLNRGCVEHCPAGPDDGIVLRSDPVLLADGSGWLWRIGRNWVSSESDRDTRLNEMRTEYTSFGEVARVYGVLHGTVPLDRRHASGGAVAPAPVGAAVDGEYLHSSSEWDEFGNPTSERAPGDRCGEIEYDPVYRQLAIVDRAYPAGCEATGGPMIQTAATYDRGLGLPIMSHSPQGQTVAIEVDGLGRLLRLYEEEADRSFDPTHLPPPSAIITYSHPTPTRHYSMVSTWIAQGETIRSTAFPDDYQRSVSLVDGFGRTLATLVQADRARGDSGDWIVNAVTDLDAKGHVRRKYEPFFWTGSPEGYPIQSRISSVYGSQRYDAFDRPLQTFDLDGTLTLQTVYRPLARDDADAEDMSAGPHAGTPRTVQYDGFGRIVVEIDRFRNQGQLVERTTETGFHPLGSIETVRRSSSDSTEEVFLWRRYDSQGHVVIAVDPSTSRVWISI